MPCVHGTCRHHVGAARLLHWRPAIKHDHCYSSVHDNITDRRSKIAYRITSRYILMSLWTVCSAGSQHHVVRGRSVSRQRPGDSDWSIWRRVTTSHSLSSAVGACFMLRLKSDYHLMQFKHVDSIPPTNQSASMTRHGPKRHAHINVKNINRRSARTPKVHQLK